MKKLSVVLVVIFLGFMAAQVEALTFTGSGVNDFQGDTFLSAEAIFEVDSTNTDRLIVTLTNTSEDDVERPSDVLTAVFFDFVGSPAATLTVESAFLNSGSSTVVFPEASDVGGDGTNPGDPGNVGGEWAYNSGLSGPSPASQGISSVGLSLFGPGDRFDTTIDLAFPDSPNGLQYGIVSAYDDLTTGNDPVTGGYPLIQDSVVFTLLGFSGYTLDLISNVSFQYGTALDEPNIPGTPPGTPPPSVVPEPSTVLLLGAGLLGLVGLGRKRIKK